MALDPAAIKTSKDPVFLTENGHTAAIIDVGVYDKFSQDEKFAFLNKLFKNSAFPEGSPEREAAIRSVEDVIKNQRISNAGDQMTGWRRGFIIIGDKDDFVKGDAKTNAVVYDFTVHHECGHEFYGFSDPASDYMAAVKTLLAAPESRETLQKIADERFMDGFFGLRHPKDTHGPECGEAIADALRLTPEQLNELRQMPEEQRLQRIAENAQKYDHLADMHRDMDPALNPVKKVENYMNGVLKTIGPNDNPYAKMDQAIEKSPFKKGDEEDLLLRGYVESWKSLFDKGQTIKKDPPAPAPKLEDNLPPPAKLAPAMASKP